MLEEQFDFRVGSNRAHGCAPGWLLGGWLLGGWLHSDRGGSVRSVAHGPTAVCDAPDGAHRMPGRLDPHVVAVEDPVARRLLLRRQLQGDRSAEQNTQGPDGPPNQLEAGPRS